MAITKFSEVLDQMVHLTFPTLIQKIQEQFGQTITPQQEQYNQGLVINNGKFSFVNFKDETIFICGQSPELDRIFIVLS